MEELPKEVEERFIELLDHYKRSYEGENRAVNILRHKPNSILEQEIKLFIAQEISQAVENERERIVQEINKLPRFNPYRESDEYDAGLEFAIKNIINLIEK